MKFRVEATTQTPEMFEVSGAENINQAVENYSASLDLSHFIMQTVWKSVGSDFHHELKTFNLQIVLSYKMFKK